MRKTLKYYIYQLPKEFEPTEELPLASKTFFDLQEFFKNNSTRDPSAADFFFVPLNLVQFQFKNVDPKSILKYLPYLDSKKNHILVATGDFSQRGKKNHFGEAYKVPYDWLSKFILLALESTSDLIPGLDVGIIPTNTLVEEPNYNNNKRPFLYSFLGETNHPFLPKNHIRNKVGRVHPSTDSLIASKLRWDLKIKLLLNYQCKDDYELVARNSTFTLCPAGYGRWTYRFFQAICWGSIPILLSDDYIKPFSKYIPYDDFSITYPESKIAALDSFIRDISPERIETLQKNLCINQKFFTKRSFFSLLTKELQDIRK